jgi:hypothetical protein
MSGPLRDRARDEAEILMRACTVEELNRLVALIDEDVDLLRATLVWVAAIGHELARQANDAGESRQDRRSP